MFALNRQKGPTSMATGMNDPMEVKFKVEPEGTCSARLTTRSSRCWVALWKRLEQDGSGSGLWLFRWATSFRWGDDAAIDVFEKMKVDARRTSWGKYIVD